MIKKYKCSKCKNRLFYIELSDVILLRCHKCNEIQADLTPKRKENINIDTNSIEKPTIIPSENENHTTN